MSENDKKMLGGIVLDAFQNHYNEKKIVGLGKRVVAPDFKKMPPGKRNALGEVLAVVRHAEVPLSHLADLAIQHFPTAIHPDEANVIRAIAAMAEQDTKNPFHNSRHVGDALISLIALWHVNKLSLERLPVHVMKILGHDLGHPGLTNQHGKFAGRTDKECIERDSLKALGLVEKDGKVVVLENSVFNSIRDEKRRGEIVETVWQGILDTELTNAIEVRKEFISVWNDWADGKVSQQVFDKALERVIGPRADVLASQTYHGGKLHAHQEGNKSLPHALLEEWKQALNQEPDITEEEIARKLAEIEGIISTKGQAGFINNCGPCTPGEFEMGLFHEKIWLVNKLLYDRNFPSQLGFETLPSHKEVEKERPPRGQVVSLGTLCSAN